MIFGSAFAADLPSTEGPITKGPAAPAPPFSWTGFYVGAQGGYGWGHSTHCDGTGCNVPGVIYPQFNTSGATLGGTLGFNYQIDNVVLGLEGDYSWADIKGSSPNTAGFGCGGRCSTEINGFGTIRGRLGYAFGQFLPYLTGGVAFTNLKASLGNVASGSTMRTSGTVGAGVEYAFTPNWSAKAEYLYITDPGKFRYGPTTCAAPGCFTTRNDYSVFRVGLNYRFGG